MARYDDLNTTIIAYSTILSTVALAAIVLAFYALASVLSTAQAEKMLDRYEYTTSETTQREQLASINGQLGWVRDPAPEPVEGEEPEEPKLRLQVPIDMAIEITLDKLKSQEKVMPAPEA